MRIQRSSDLLVAILDSCAWTGGVMTRSVKYVEALSQEGIPLSAYRLMCKAGA